MTAAPAPAAPPCVWAWCSRLGLVLASALRARVCACCSRLRFRAGVCAWCSHMRFVLASEFRAGVCAWCSRLRFGLASVFGARVCVSGWRRYLVLESAFALLTYALGADVRGGAEIHAWCWCGISCWRARFVLASALALVPTPARSRLDGAIDPAPEGQSGHASGWMAPSLSPDVSATAGGAPWSSISVCGRAGARRRGREMRYRPGRGRATPVQSSPVHARPGQGGGEAGAGLTPPGAALGTRIICIGGWMATCGTRIPISGNPVN